MNNQKEVDISLIALYLNEYGAVPLMQIARELGSFVRAIVAVDELNRRGWVNVITPNPETLIVAPGERLACALA